MKITMKIKILVVKILNQNNKKNKIEADDESEISLPESKQLDSDNAKEELGKDSIENELKLFS